MWAKWGLHLAYIRPTKQKKRVIYSIPELTGDAQGLKVLATFAKAHLC